MAEIDDYYGIDHKGFRIPEPLPYPIIDLVKAMIAKGAFADVGGPGLTDHGMLTGLADDDHPQYFNIARGDARYALIIHSHGIADVTGLQTALDAKVDDSQISAFSLTLLDDTDAASWRSDLGLGTSATHDSTDYALAIHTHPESEVSGLIADLAGKSPLVHDHTASEITDFSAAVLALIPAATTYTADETTLHLTGTVFSIKALGVGTAQIAAAAVTYAKIQNLSATDLVLGRSSAGAGTVQEIAFTAGARTWSALADLAAQKTYLGLTGTNSGDQTITLTGDVTGSGTASFAATIANDAVTYAKIQNVTNDKVLGRFAGTTGDVQEISFTAGARAFSQLADLPAQKSYLGIGGAASTITDWKDNVYVSTTANITLSGEQTLDGFLTAASRVGVAFQTLPAQNGIYVSAAGAWTRSTDADTSAEVTSGLIYAVDNGTLYGDQLFQLVTPDPIVLGTTALSFIPVSVPAGAFVNKVVAGTAYIGILLDVNKRLVFTNAAAKTLTLPVQASVAYPINVEIELYNAGAGLLTVSFAGTLSRGQLTLRQYELAKLKKRANPNDWDLTMSLTDDAAIIPCTDETTALTTGTKRTFRMPYAMDITAVRGGLTTAGTGGTLVAFDVKKNGTTLFSTKPTFDASEKTTVTAATPSVLNNTSAADDDEMTIIVDAVGSTIAGAGLKVTLLGKKK